MAFVARAIENRAQGVRRREMSLNRVTGVSLQVHGLGLHELRGGKDRDDNTQAHASPSEWLEDFHWSARIGN